MICFIEASDILGQRGLPYSRSGLFCPLASWTQSSASYDDNSLCHDCASAATAEKGVQMVEEEKPIGRDRSEKTREHGKLRELEKLERAEKTREQGDGRELEKGGEG